MNVLSRIDTIDCQEQDSSERLILFFSIIAQILLHLNLAQTNFGHLSFLSFYLHFFSATSFVLASRFSYVK